METAGNILKNEREKQGRSLNDIAKDIKIKKEYLASLENGDFDSLPAEIFTKSYIRMYAEILGINGESLIDVYKKQVEPAEPQVPETEKTFDISSYKNIVIVSVIALVIASAIFLLRTDEEVAETTTADISESSPAETTKKENDRQNTRTTENTVEKIEPEHEIIPHTEETKSLQKITPQLVEIKKERPSPETESTVAETQPELPDNNTAAEQPEVVEIKPEQPVKAEASAEDQDKNKIEPVMQETPDIKKPFTPDPKKVMSLGSPQIKNITEENITTGKKHLTVTAMEMTWVAISIDDGKTKEWLLRAGESIALTADEKFIVKTGNAGGTKLILDDKEIDAIGPPGQVAEIVLP